MSLIHRESKDKSVKAKSIANRKMFPLWQEWTLEAQLPSVPGNREKGNDKSSEDKSL
jgi:hypothetical protein